MALGPGLTVFATFEYEVNYIGSRTLQALVNCRVRYLDAMLAQPRSKGGGVVLKKRRTSRVSGDSAGQPTLSHGSSCGSPPDGGFRGPVPPRRFPCTALVPITSRRGSGLRRLRTGWRSRT